MNIHPDFEELLRLLEEHGNPWREEMNFERRTQKAELRSKKSGTQPARDTAGNMAIEKANFRLRSSAFEVQRSAFKHARENKPDAANPACGTADR